MCARVDRSRRGGIAAGRRSDHGPKAAGRWHGATVVCIASGPSLTRADCDRAAEAQARAPEEVRIIAVNDNWKMCPTADVLYACDSPWWKYNIDDVRKSGIASELWTQDEDAAKAYGLNRIRAWSKPGLSREPDTIHHGANSGYQAVCLAYVWGAARVVLLGFDCQYTGGQRHWFGDHRRGLNNATGLGCWPKNFGKMSEDCKEVGLEVINASRQTALKCFPRMTIEDALHHCR